MNRTIGVIVCSLGLWGCSPSLVSNMPDGQGTSDLGLASVFGPKKAMLAVTSDPPGAEARMSPASGCRTPCSLTFKAPGDFSVDVSLDGYVTQHQTVKVSAPETSSFVLAGTAFKLEPEMLSVQLVPVQPSAGKGRTRQQAHRDQR
jgi:hypothetical protein